MGGGEDKIRPNQESSADPHLSKGVLIVDGANAVVGVGLDSLKVEYLEASIFEVHLSAIKSA
jgi:hypothetical protein